MCISFSRVTDLYLNDDPLRNRAILLGAGIRSVLVDLNKEVSDLYK